MRAHAMKPTALHFLILTVAGWLHHRREEYIAYLHAENAVYKEHFAKRGLRLTDAQRRRLAVKGKAVGRAGLRQIATIGTPDTILRWYRQLVAQKYDSSRKRGPGRPRTRVDIAALIVRMANENPRWGYGRIRGALGVLGMFVRRSTIQRVLADHGIEPAPERGKHTRWSTFLRAHWGAIAATDFFSVEVLTLSGLVRHFVLFVIDLKSRRVEIAGMVHQPHDAWMKQVARNLTDVIDGFLRGKWKLIHDRDPLFSAGFRATLGSDVTTIKLPVKSPNLNAYAERFVLSIKSECLNHVVPLGEAHLRMLVTEFVTHYHFERSHQGLANALIVQRAATAIDNGRVQRRKRIGGVLSFYHRAAA
jgi:transposase InsO family protein